MGLFDDLIRDVTGLKAEAARKAGEEIKRKQRNENAKSRRAARKLAAELGVKLDICRDDNFWRVYVHNPYPEHRLDDEIMCTWWPEVETALLEIKAKRESA
tara:strand:+ start:271 stop:573 length:303 start_codon:yes stop_codon:yes gene_type:complete